MRTYSFLAMRAGLVFENWPPRTITSQARIRVVAHVMFRKWFGRRRVISHWHKDGFMAEVRDDRGNVMQIRQHGPYDNVEPDLTRLALEDRKS